MEICIIIPSLTLAMPCQVVLVGDCMGSVMAFDILCSLHSELAFPIGDGMGDKKKFASDTNLNDPVESRDDTDFSGESFGRFHVCRFVHSLW